MTDTPPESAAAPLPDSPAPPPAPSAMGLVMRLLIGLLLLAAAGAKVHQMATEPVGGCFGLRCNATGLAEAGVEIGLGLWLLAGVWQTAARAITALAFVVFLGVSIYRGATGEASCGCFGAVQVNPWVTATLDALVLVGLLLWRPSRDTRHAALRVAIAAVLAVASIAAAVVMVRSYRPGVVGPDAAIRGDAANVLVRLSTLPGQRWGMLDHIDIGGRMGEGEWTVILYKSDCDQCHEALARLEREMKAGRLSGNYAAVELPPHAPPEEQPFGPNPPFEVGRLEASRHWRTSTPTMIRLRDGVVISVE